MDPVETMRMSWRAVRGHPLRSALTALGVVIGVAAVITFVTLGASLQVEIVQEVGGQRATEITLWTGPEREGGPPSASAEPVFTERDVEGLRGVAGVTAVVPQGQVPVTTVRTNNSTIGLRGVTATTSGHFTPDEITEGRPFHQGAKEVVLNPTAARSVRGNVSVGDRVRLQYADGRVQNATVVGITAETENLFGFGSQPRVYVPTDPFYETRVESPATGERMRAYPVVRVVAVDAQSVEEVKGLVINYLQRSSDARNFVPRGYDFYVRTNQDLLDQVRDLLETLTAFVTGVAVISLIVGTIGIANVMLVSVTERTREIGIMKAVGAQNRDVLQLFLVESAILGVLGAALGALAGVLGGYAATEYVGLPLVFPMEWGAIAVAVGITVGAIAGLYPAWRAARTDPIEALRYE
jgi:putative ABC transport system permease protein